MATVRTYRVGATGGDDALPGIGLQTRQQIQLFESGIHLPGARNREGFGAAVSNLHSAKHSHAIGDDTHLFQPDADSSGKGSLEQLLGLCRYQRERDYQGEWPRV